MDLEQRSSPVSFHDQCGLQSTLSRMSATGASAVKVAVLVEAGVVLPCGDGGRHSFSSSVSFQDGYEMWAISISRFMLTGIEDGSALLYWLCLPGHLYAST